MEAGTTSTTLTAKLPILNPGDYDLWLMRIEQYFLMTDYSLWEVILNGNKVLKRKVGETEQEYEPTTAEEKQDRRNEIKARGTLLMALPNKDQLKYHSYKDAKLLMESIKKMYGGNKESKKVQRTLLKQQYKNFAGSSSETMDQTFDCLPSESNTHALIWRNKVETKTISLDDLYNNLKIYELELIGLSTSQNLQNVAFVSSNSTNSNSNSSTNEADNTAYRVSVAHTQSNPTTGDNLSDDTSCVPAERSTSMVPMICRLSSYLVTLRTTKAFVPSLLRCSAYWLGLSLFPHDLFVKSNVGILRVWKEFFLCLNKSTSAGERILPLIEKLSSLLAKLDIESSRSAG
ncbi:hypothetical protein Tco_1238918 [Tanacetum coccineum]